MRKGRNPKSMRNPPFSPRQPAPGRPRPAAPDQRRPRSRLALLSLAGLVAFGPLVIDGLVQPAGADTAGDCTAAFSSAPAASLSYTTDPPERYARMGQTVSLAAAWDPAAWDGLTAATACVQLNDSDDAGLGATEATPADDGAFAHSFTIPSDIPEGSVLCARIRLAGDPAGPETEAVWVSKTHCFEVDHETETPTPEAMPPPPPLSLPPPPSSSPGTPTPDTTATPGASPTAAAPPAETPGAATAAPGSPGLFSPEGGGSAPGTPFEEAAPPPTPGPPTPPSAAKASAPPTPVPMLPATGWTDLPAHAGAALFFFGLAFLVLCGRRPRRRAAP